MARDGMRVAFDAREQKLQFSVDEMEARLLRQRFDQIDPELGTKATYADDDISVIHGPTRLRAAPRYAPEPEEGSDCEKIDKAELEASKTNASQAWQERARWIRQL